MLLIGRADCTSMAGTTGRRRRPHPIQYLHYMNHGRETAHSSEMATQPMGSNSGTHKGTVDDLKKSRNLYRNEVACSFNRS